jgi:hypothetical protein
VKKVSKKSRCQQSSAYASNNISRFEGVSYDSICSLVRLFEKEVELFRMISKLVKKVAASKRSQEASEVCGEGGSSDSLPLQISDVF